MVKTYMVVFAGSLLFLDELLSGVEKGTLIVIIFVLTLLIVAMVGFEIVRFARNEGKGSPLNPFRRVKLFVFLDKDRMFYPQMLTLTIKNRGKRGVQIEAPVLEFRKVWSKRRFKLNGTNKNVLYPTYVDGLEKHQLFIETERFYHYDREIRSYYWVRVYVSDVEGRKWKSNDVKLRKSLVT
jgi:hypothetical protein